MIWDLAIWLFISGLVGARLWYVVQYHERVFAGRMTLSEKFFACVNISAGGQIRMAGRQLTLEQFQERLVKRREKYGQVLEVRIRSDRSVPYRNINPVMRRCAETGIWNVTFAVYRPGEGS